MTRQIILASVSPRRRQIMKLLDVPFLAVDSGYEEVMHKHLSHPQLVKYLAKGKAEAAAKKYPNAIIVAADTIVSFKGKALGKPKDKADAIKTLKSFGTKQQEIVTGVVVLDAKTKKSFAAVVKNKIYFKKLSDKEIMDYLKSGEAYDKAGGYGPLGKGINLTAKLTGEYTASLGLPMKFVYNSLRKLNVKV